MGCGGSKQQDVAAGNTITRRSLRGSSTAAEGKETAAAAAVDGAEKAPDSSSEEYFSSRREVEGLDALVAGTEVADDLYLADHAATAASNKEGSTLSVLEKKEEEEEIAINNEDNGKSIGNLSVDFKEAISMDEKEAEALKTEKTITEVAITTTTAAAEEKKNSGENKTESV